MLYFVLFSNCIIVKGFSRSAICDLQKNKIYFIPNELAELINSNENKLLLEIVNESDFKLWFEMLITEEIGFVTLYPQYFPKIKMDWDSPEIINNAIIEMDSISMVTLSESIVKLNQARCKFIEFRFYKNSNIEILIDIIDLLRDGFIRGITVYVPFPQDKDLSQIRFFLKSTGLVRELIVHSTQMDEIMDQGVQERLSFTPQCIRSNTHCGEISSDYFAININSFTESTKFNSCLNKKISIDSAGQIRNCPSMVSSFGSIKDIELVSLVKNKKFTKDWSISKDKIEVCKDCEFRYVCTDCRAYIENPKDSYSKPLKCGYDPYTNIWEEWSTNPLKQNTIAFYKMEDLKPQNI